MMVKLFMRGSWMLCLLNGMLAVVTRLLASVGSVSALFSGRSLPIGYHAFMDGALLFFMLTVASASVEFIDKRFQ
jgi:hypothetical protein